jgi:hypothetical protein
LVTLLSSRWSYITKLRRKDKTKLETYKAKMSFQIETTYLEERRNLLINNKQGIHHPE